MAPSYGEITRLPAVVRCDDAGEESNLIELVCRDLHAIARHWMELERPGHTLQPTALVREAYYPMLGDRAADRQSRADFFVAASVEMWRILVDHVCPPKAGKRPAPRHGVGLDDSMAWNAPCVAQFVIIDETLWRVAGWDARRARRDEMIFCGCLTEEKAATALSICVRTVKHDCSAARVWLQAQFGRASA